MSQTSWTMSLTDATSDPNGFTVMIYNNAGHGGPFPSSTVKGTLVGTMDPSTDGIYTYTAPPNLMLLPDNDYFIVLTAGTTVANGAYEWSLAGTSSFNHSDVWHFDGIFTSSDGSSWTLASGIVPQFAINATPVPEPSVLGLLGVGGLLFLRHRHKAKAA